MITLFSELYEVPDVSEYASAHTSKQKFEAMFLMLIVLSKIKRKILEMI